MSQITVNGARLFYAIAGGGQPPYVLVPGWCCDHTSLSPLAEHLESRHTVVGVDMRGMGQSERPRGAFTMADLVEDLRDLCEQLGIVRPILIGHSLGGRVVLAYLEAHPGLARGGVLLDVAIDEAPDYVLARRAEIEGMSWKAALSGRFGRLLSPPAGALSKDIVERMLDTPIDVARAYLRAADDFDATHALSRCRVPLLYIGASEPRESHGRLLELNPGLMYGQVVGSGHFVQVDAAAQVAAMVDRFAEIVMEA